MYIATPDAADDDITRLNETLQGVVTKEGGNIVRVDDIGRRRMAYEINRKREGYYVLFEIEGSGREIAELERRMRVSDLVMRYLTVRVDEDRKAADKIRAKREKRRSARAAFRAGTSPQQQQDAGAQSETAAAQDNQ
jgi:small subunit ribosomal protein S6